MTSSTRETEGIRGKIVWCFKKIGSIFSEVQSSVENVIERRVDFLIEHTFGLSRDHSRSTNRESMNSDEGLFGNGEVLPERLALIGGKCESDEETIEFFRRELEEEEESFEHDLSEMYCVPVSREDDIFPSQVTSEEIESMVIESNKMQEHVLEEAICYVRRMISTITYTFEMKDVLSTPMLIIFDMKSLNFPYPEEVEKIEKEFFRTKPSIYGEMYDMPYERIIEILSEGIKPTFSIYYWTVENVDFDRVYKRLFHAILGSIISERKKGTRVEKTIIFYREILKYVRNTIEDILGQLTEEAEVIKKKSRQPPYKFENGTKGVLTKITKGQVKFTESKREQEKDSTEQKASSKETKKELHVTETKKYSNLARSRIIKRYINEYLFIIKQKNEKKKLTCDHLNRLSKRDSERRLFKDEFDSIFRYEVYQVYYKSMKKEIEKKKIMHIDSSTSVPFEEPSTELTLIEEPSNEVPSTNEPLAKVAFTEDKKENRPWIGMLPVLSKSSSSEDIRKDNFTCIIVREPFMIINVNLKVDGFKVENKDKSQLITHTTSLLEQKDKKPVHLPKVSNTLQIKKETPSAEDASNKVIEEMKNSEMFKKQKRIHDEMESLQDNSQQEDAAVPTTPKKTAKSILPIINYSENLITDLRNSEMFKKQRLSYRKEEIRQEKERKAKLLAESGQAPPLQIEESEDELTIDDLSDDCKKTVKIGLVSEIQHQHMLNFNVNSHTQIIDSNKQK